MQPQLFASHSQTAGARNSCLSIFVRTCLNGEGIFSETVDQLTTINSSLGSAIWQFCGVTRDASFTACLSLLLTLNSTTASCKNILFRPSVSLGVSYAGLNTLIVEYLLSSMKAIAFQGNGKPVICNPRILRFCSFQPVIFSNSGFEIGATQCRFKS